MIPTKLLSIAAVKRAIRSWSFDHALVGSVVPKKTVIFRNLFRDRMKEVTSDLDLGIGIDFSDPAGSVRTAWRMRLVLPHVTGLRRSWLILERRLPLTSFPARACTKGVIAPGLGVMVDYMYQRTALLPKIDLEEPVSVIGKSTKNAMLAGAVYGYRGLSARS